MTGKDLQDCMNANKVNVSKPRVQLLIWMRCIEYKELTIIRNLLRLGFFQFGVVKSLK